MFLAVSFNFYARIIADDGDGRFHCIPSSSSQEIKQHSVCGREDEIDNEEPSLESKTAEDVERNLTKIHFDPFVEESSGAWLLNEYDVDCIATGAGILGCGGGGNPYLGKLSAVLALKSGQEMRVIHPDR
jgi:hypothetical protein